MRRHTLDLGLLGGEVVGDGVHPVGGRSFRELGLGDHGAPVERVGLAVGVDQLGVHVDLHVVGLEVAVLVGDVALVVDVDHLVAHVVDQRVGVLSRDGVVEKGLGRAQASDGVAPERVVGGKRVGLAGHERVELRTGNGVAHFLRQGIEFVAAAFFFAEIAADVPALGARGSRVGQAPFRRPGRSGIVHDKRVGRAERFAAHRSC